jgi:hypothetical protein
MPRERLLSLFTCLCLSVGFLKCGGGPPKNSSTPTPEATSTSPVPQSSPLTGFAKDLAYVRNGGYSYVFIFSRKDKKPLDKDDGTYLRANAPQVVDWVMTDEGKRVIAGTNFNLEEGNMDALKKRFVVEDYSNK